MTLRDALRRAADGLPKVSTYTIQAVLKEAGFGWRQTRTWCALYTPLSGSRLNMCESVQRIIKRRALECQHPKTTEEIIRLLEATVTGWNLNRTAFEWGGRRAARRRRSRERAAQRVGGSGAVVRQAIGSLSTLTQ